MMKKAEMAFVRALCSFYSDSLNEEMLNYATPEVLGFLFYNRMQSVAYGHLKQKDLLGGLNREFRNSLKAAYDYNISVNYSYFQCVDWINDLLRRSNCQFAMLKGALLCKIYPEGYRTSNDIDLLISPEEVTFVGETLKREGFRQGYIRNSNFIPASRMEIISSKMMRGETVPYIKKVDLPGMEYLEVDINFSLDYKSGKEDVLQEFLNTAQEVNFRGMSVTTLKEKDFFLHLCCHLYKEATTLPWIQMKRDMSLYKFCDIYMLLETMTKEDIQDIYEHAIRFGLEKICAFTMLYTASLFDQKTPIVKNLAESVLWNDKQIMHQVFDPKGKKQLIYTEEDLVKRFFCDSRESLLMEE